MRISRRGEKMNVIRFIDKLYSMIEVVDQDIKMYSKKSSDMTTVEYASLLSKQKLLEDLIEDFETGRIE